MRRFRNGGRANIGVPSPPCKSATTFRGMIRGPIRPLFAVVLSASLSWGCGSEGADDAAAPFPPETPGFEQAPPEPSPEGSTPVVGAEHLRVLAFVSFSADSSTLLPWTFRSTVTENGIERVRSLSVARGSEWEWLAADSLVTPLNRFPWRILPGGPIRMVAGQGDALLSLGFEDATRSLELLPGEFLAEWVPGAGTAWRVHRASVLFPGGESTGLLLDLNRSRGPGGAVTTDWAFLHAGPATQVMLAEIPGGERGPAGASTWVGRTRVAFQERDWPAVQVEWRQVRSFDQARRDVPATWALRVSPPPDAAGGPRGEAPLVGELRVRRSFLVADEAAPGPVLPVSGFFEVEGEITVLGERIPVRGLVRHLQP